MENKIVSVTILFVVSILMPVCRSQRPPFAGTRPIGYPEMVTEPAALADRFGEADGTTQRLPIEALGDRNLVDRLSKLPIDQQPFWFINWQALEANRKNPQTYPQRPNSFVSSNTNSGQNVGTVDQNGTANRFSSIESSGSSNGSSTIGTSEKVSSSSPSKSTDNFDNVSGTSGSPGTIDGLIPNSTSTSSVSGVNKSSNQNSNLNPKGKEKKNNYTY